VFCRINVRGVYTGLAVMNQPDKIGKYEVLARLGRGGMGVVYKAYNPQLDILVAIKMMTVDHAEDTELLQRFYREAQATASLQHPNIVTVFDLGEQDGSPYLVMQYLEGENLDSILTSGRPLGAAEKIHYILEACHGLSYAHGRGIVHRDIKPANIMILKDGGVKLVDFGIAHIASNTLTRTGQVMGSLNYMSPEQIGGSVDARTDIFSMGVVLYQLFTNRLPFDGGSTASTLQRILHDPPPPLAQFRTNCPKEIEAIILHALAKNREERYQSADELALDLLQVHEQLKEELVSRHLHEAEALFEKGELKPSREQLQQALRLDQKHTKAIKLLRQVQQQIDKWEAAEQARQLKAAVEECYLRGDFETALRQLDQATSSGLTLNQDLLQLRERVREARTKAEELQRALRRAEQAHERGDLDDAKEAADEALEIDPDNTQAKALYRIIHRDWVERSRQRQLETLLQSARKEFGVNNLTAALNILKQAEVLDPEGAHVRALMDEVVAAREQQARHRELQQINHDVEEALNREDYEAASAKIAEGLRRFPRDRTLAQLKILTDRQLVAAQRKAFVREQMAEARTLLDTGHAPQALALLESAAQKVPQEPELETLLAMVREVVFKNEQEQRQREVEQINRDVQQALSQENYEAADNRVETGLTRFPADRSLANLKDLVSKQRRASEQESFVRQQIALARKLLDSQQASDAAKILQRALQKVPQDPRLETLLNFARDQVARETAEQEKDRLLRQAREALAAHAYAQAIALLETAQLRFVHSPEIDALLRFAYEQQQKELERKEIEETLDRVNRWISESQFDPAIELLEAAFLRTKDDQLGLILEETRRRREDFERDRNAALTRAQQFLREGAAQKARDFLAAQPQAYGRSPEFRALLEIAEKQSIIESVESQLASEPNLNRQIRIIETAEKKYPAYNHHWQRTLRSVKERRQLAASTVLLAEKLERAKRYGEALQQWLRLRTIHEQHPGLEQEIERLTRLADEVRLREQTVRQEPSGTVITPPPEATRIQSIGSRIRRRSRSLAGIGMAVILVAGVVYFVLHRGRSIQPNTATTKQELELQAESKAFRSAGRFQEAIDADQKLEGSNGTLFEWAKQDLAEINELLAKENSLMDTAQAAAGNKDWNQALRLYQNVIDLHAARESEARAAIESVQLKRDNPEANPIDLADKQLNQGIAAFNRKEYRSSLEILRNVLTGSPQDWANRSEAQKYLKDSTARVGQGDLMNKAGDAFRLKNYDLARDSATQALKVKDGDPDATRRAALLLQDIQVRVRQKSLYDDAIGKENGNAQEAIARLRQVRDFQNGDPDLVSNAKTEIAKLEKLNPPVNANSTLVADITDSIKQRDFDTASKKLKELNPADPSYNQLSQDLDDAIFADNKRQADATLAKTTDPNRQSILQALQLFFTNIKTGRHATEAELYALKIENALKQSFSPPPKDPTVSDEQRIGKKLEVYKDAFQSKNPEELRTVWPSLTDKRFREMTGDLREVQSIQITLNCASLQISGNEAVQSCEQNMDIVVDSRVQSLKNAITFRWKKLGAHGEWVIYGIDVPKK
jgi:eukaryotic-like serine/threonine-protein kinase